MPRFFSLRLAGSSYMCNHHCTSVLVASISWMVNPHVNEEEPHDKWLLDDLQVQCPMEYHSLAFRATRVCICFWTCPWQGQGLLLRRSGSPQSFPIRKSITRCSAFHVDFFKRPYSPQNWGKVTHSASSRCSGKCLWISKSLKHSIPHLFLARSTVFLCCFHTELGK